MDAILPPNQVQNHAPSQFCLEVVHEESQSTYISWYQNSNGPQVVEFE